MLTITEQLLEEKRIPTQIRQRRNPMNFLTVDKKLIGDHEAEGWEIDRRNKKSVRMKRPKAHDVAFEDRVWAVAAGLGFRKLNRDRKFTIQYGPTPSDSRQIDVFAADDETVLVVECKSTENPRASALKKDIEALQGCERGIRTAIRDEFPDHKVKFIFATNGFGLTQPDQERIDSAKYVHLDEDAIEYYEDLLTHLGPAARYQFLGMLFAGQKIPGMDSAVTALRAKMGGHTYYSFSIEPERLLKIAYVLHRNKANSELMPTYQRLIKRTRLKQVREFVDDGGFFPNSLIINVDAPKRGLGFDKFAGQSGSDAVAGTLKLPQQFRSAYVIDGQHRLYGYVNAKRGSSDLVPVVAFENLDRAEQVRIFMQINENQKAVPKNLRNTLNADLLWDSEDLNARARALKLRIAQHLGESKRSPLYGRIIIGENKKSKTCCIAIDTISTALDRGSFIGTFTKTEMTKAGTLHRGTNEATLNEVTALLERYFDYLREQLPEQWRLANEDGGFVFINNGVESLIRLLSDVIDHLCKEEGYNPLQIETGDLFEAAKYYLDPAVRFLEDADAATASDLRRSYGIAGRTRYWRRLQQAVQEERSEFTPEGLADFLRNEEKAFNTESFEIVRELELFFKEDIRERLRDEFGTEWLKKGLPRKIYLDAANLATEKNLDRSSGEELGPWDCLHLINYREIVSQSSDLWSRLFAKQYTRPGDEHLAGGFKARSSWMVELNRIRNENDHTYSVTEDEYDFLVELKRWLLDGEVDNELPVV